MTRQTFASVQKYALDNGYEVVRTSEGYSIYPCDGNLAECMGGYKARTLNIAIEVIKEGYGLHGQYCELPLQYDQLTDIYDNDFCKEESIEVPPPRLLPNYVIDFFLLAFDIKLTATVIEIYCAEISKDCDNRSVEHPEIKPDLIGTASMFLGWDANTLFANAVLGYTDDMPEFWFICLNACTATIQPIINNNAFELFSDEPGWMTEVIDMFSESEEDFNNRIILEEICRSDENQTPFYWDTKRNTFCDTPIDESITEIATTSRGSSR